MPLLVSLAVLTVAAQAPIPAPLSPIPIGIYVGNPDGNVLAKMQAFQQQWDATVTQLRRSPAFFETFVDYGLEWSQWPSNAGWTAWSWKKVKGRS